MAKLHDSYLTKTDIAFLKTLVSKKYHSYKYYYGAKSSKTKYVLGLVSRLENDYWLTAYGIKKL